RLVARECRVILGRRGLVSIGKTSPDVIVFQALTCALVGLGLFLIPTLKAGAQPNQPEFVRVLQSPTGPLFIVHGPAALPLNPGQLSDEDLASLSIGEEIDGTLLPVQNTSDGSAPVISYVSDGTLYFVANTIAHPLVPDSIADEDLAALTVGPEI